jgi:predicted neutral ceramidase superfamily lipid hydrolase
MNKATKSYLQGQIIAIQVLAERVAEIVDCHCPLAAKELEAIKYACNRAHTEVEKGGAR